MDEYECDCLPIPERDLPEAEEPPVPYWIRRRLEREQPMTRPAEESD